MTRPDTSTHMHRSRDTPEEQDTNAPRIQIGTGPETIRVLRSVLTDGTLPDTYVSAGELVHMEQVSGGPPSVAADEDAPLPVAASRISPALLAGLLARHT